MTRRPERLKATKLYAPVQLTDTPEHTEGNKDKHTAASEPSVSIKPRPTQIPDKRNPKTVKSDRNSNIVDENAVENNQQGKKETRKTNSNAETKSRAPKGFVTRKDMIDKLNKRRGTSSNSSKSEMKLGPPKGFVTRAEMEKRLMKKTPNTVEIQEKSSTHHTENDTVQKVNDNDLPAALNTKKDSETYIQHRKTKTTKITPAYVSNQHQTTQRYSTQSETKSQDLQGADRVEQKPKHLFSKLENKGKGVSGLQDGEHSTENKLSHQNQSGEKRKQETVKTLKETKPVLPANKKTEGETVASKVEGLNIDKKKTGVTGSDRMTSASTKKSSNTVTPRMTSTAIAKPTRGIVRGNQLSDVFSNVKMDSVKILIMNANGRDDKGGSPTERRKHAIHNVVTKHEPDIVLFQEFSWSGIAGKAWIKYPFPEHFVYKGHYDASIMYNETCITVEDLPASDIDTILSGLQRNASNRLKRTFPMDFNPVARMCISRITAPTKHPLDFLCISWHGKSNETGGGRMKELKKIEYFEYWMEFLRNIREKYKLPILAAGDYNVDMYSIENYVQSPFKLCIYEASMRRTVRGIVDFCIVTDDLEFSDITWVNLERDTSVFHPSGILDHDPIVGSLTVSALALSEAALGMGKKKSWPSPISKQR